MKSTCLFFGIMLITISSFRYGIKANTPKDKIISDTTELKNYFDGSGVFVSLYKNTGGITYYWEVWNTDDIRGLIHVGELGEQGKEHTIKATTKTGFQRLVNNAVQEKINEGYSEISDEKQYTVEINFLLKKAGTQKDLDKSEDVKSGLDEALAATGNGSCEEAKINGNELTLYADVIEPYLAIKTISKELKNERVKTNYYFSITQGNKTIKERIEPE